MSRLAICDSTGDGKHFALLKSIKCECCTQKAEHGGKLIWGHHQCSLATRIKLAYFDEKISMLPTRLRILLNGQRNLILTPALIKITSWGSITLILASFGLQN
jgi:hypothetical protein